MITIGSLIEERVQKIEYVTIVAVEFLFVRLVLFQRFNPLRMISVTGHLLQYLNLSLL